MKVKKEIGVAGMLNVVSLDCARARDELQVWEAALGHMREPVLRGQAKVGTHVKDVVS